MGVFKNNYAHTFSKYGFRGKTHIPIMRPEDDYVNYNLDSPWTFNPSINAVYEDFYAWKNGDNGF